MSKSVSYRIGPFIDPQGLLTVVLIMLMGGMVLDLVSLVSKAMQYELLSRMAGQGAWSEAETSSNDMREQILNLVDLGWTILAAIPFLKLLGRFNHNAWSFGARGMEYTPGWTIGSFFVPILSLFQPYQAVQQIWKVSQKGSGGWTNRLGSSLIGLWWALWIAQIILGQALRVTGQNNSSIGQLQGTTITQMIMTANHLLLSGVAIVMLRQLSQAQLAKQESGERYDRADDLCEKCGEPIAANMERCAMCGADRPAEPDILPGFPPA